MTGDGLMDFYTGAYVIIFMCVLILCVASLRRRAEFLINILLRSVTGTAVIYFVNQILASQQLQTMVGVNPVSVLTSGILGLPGLALLYGIHIFQFL